MSITCMKDANIVFWTVAKLLVTFEKRGYLIAAQCIWWIAALVQLDLALRHFIDTRKLPSEGIHISEISESIRPPNAKEIPPTPRYIQQRSESDNYELPARDQYQPESLW